jgi:hypothetical protein
MKKEIISDNQTEYRVLIGVLDNGDNYECLHKSKEVIPRNKFTRGSVRELAFYHFLGNAMSPSGSLSMEATRREDSPFEAKYVLASDTDEDLVVMENIVNHPKLD